MNTLLALGAVSLAVIAVCQVVRLFLDWRRPLDSVDEDEEVYPACEMPRDFAGLIGPCCRRRGHFPPCRSEAEVEHLSHVIRAEEFGQTRG